MTATSAACEVTCYQFGRWAWQCQECGWRGVDLASEESANREAGAHMRRAHPETGATP